MEITLSKIHTCTSCGIIIINQEPSMYIIFIAMYYFNMHLGEWKKIDETLLPVMCIIMWLNDCNLSKVNFQPNWGLSVVLLICGHLCSWPVGCSQVGYDIIYVLYAVALHSCDHCGSVSLCINYYCDFFGLSLLLPWLG